MTKPTEAETERAAIVAWLRGEVAFYEANAEKMETIHAGLARSYSSSAGAIQLALESIERLTHLQGDQS